MNAKIARRLAGIVGLLAVTAVVLASANKGPYATKVTVFNNIDCPSSCTGTITYIIACSGSGSACTPGTVPGGSCSGTCYRIGDDWFCLNCT
jgi:hypothetical protein